LNVRDAQYCRDLPPFGTLPHQPNRIAAADVVPYSVVEKNTHEISGFGAARTSKRQRPQPQFNFSCVDARKEVISPARQYPFAQVAFVCQFRGVGLPNSIGFELPLPIVLCQLCYREGLTLESCVPEIDVKMETSNPPTCADSSTSWSMRPITILRCLRLPSGPGSRHLNSQTFGPILRSACMMLPCCIERPFCASQPVHPENRLVLVGTIQAQIFGHHGRGDPEKLRGEMIGYRFPAEITARTSPGKQWMCLSATTLRLADDPGVGRFNQHKCVCRYESL